MKSKTKGDGKVEARLIEDRAIIWDAEEGKKIFESDYYGKFMEDRLELALVEAMLLLEEGRIAIIDADGKRLSIDEMKEICRKADQRFDVRYTVYRDLRKRELPTRTGFKFGCDFRVYDRGVKPLKRGPKAAKEHTKWIVFSVQEGYTFSFPELSRAVRLAHNIRANMLWAVVSESKEVKYYQVTFFKP